MTINIPVEVPDWAKWLTIDHDGTYCIWELKPDIRFISHEYLWESDSGKMEELTLSDGFSPISPDDFTREIYEIKYGNLIRYP